MYIFLWKCFIYLTVISKKRGYDIMKKMLFLLSLISLSVFSADAFVNTMELNYSVGKKIIEQEIKPVPEK